jgi:hypothetical protein
VILAGFVAMTGALGVAVASALLVFAVIVGVVGEVYARNRHAGWASAAIVSAALPLFIPLYLIGNNIFRRLGPGIAGGLLIVMGAAAGVGAFMYATKMRRRGVEAWQR